MEDFQIEPQKQSLQQKSTNKKNTDRACGKWQESVTKST